jgi:hypothetical protein
MNERPHPRFVALVVLAVLALGCSTPDPNARTLVAGPDEAEFGPVNAVLDHRCGSLDCHGTRYRNMRLWGHDGMRLAVEDVPGASPTTPAEVQASYTSIVELEPEITDAVVADHGANSERLTFIRKARGTEQHTGGAIVVPGDARDRCILSWLMSATDTTACAEALVLP